MQCIFKSNSISNPFCAEFYLGRYKDIQSDLCLKGTFQRWERGGIFVEAHITAF